MKKRTYSMEDEPGFRLTQVRKRLGMSVSRVSEKTGIAPSTIQTIEERTFETTSVEKMVTLCELYNISLDWIMSEVKDSDLVVTPDTEIVRKFATLSHEDRALIARMIQILYTNNQPPNLDRLRVRGRKWELTPQT